MIRKAAVLLASTGLFISLALWAISYARVSYNPRSSRRPSILIANGWLVVVTGLYFGPDRGLRVQGYRGPETRFWPRSGVMFYTWARGAGMQLPLWIPAFLCACTLWLIAHRRRRSLMQQALCIKCGYDLRGSRDRCPECGRLVKIA